MSSVRREFRVLAWSLALALGLLACGESASPTTTKLRPSPATSTTARPAPSGGNIVISPEFIQGVIPGARLILLVVQSDPSAGPIEVSAEAAGAEVTVQPSSISGAEVAEVTVIPGPTTEEGPLDITITAGGGSDARSFTRTVTIVPWEDDREDEAREILALFTDWLALNRPELNLSPETELSGGLMAPNLLVVCHYAFFNDEWELGLSWHVMLPPDDFSELYLRERSELGPSLAFRVGSWQTALEDGSAEIVEVDPPAEVVR